MHKLRSFFFCAALLATLGGTVAHADEAGASTATGATTAANGALAAVPEDAASAPAALPAALPSTFRDRLAARGVGFEHSLTGLLIGDVAGGLKPGGVYNSLGIAGTRADLGKLTGWWKGAEAYASVYWIRGRSVSWEFVGDALAVSNLDGFDSIRLYDAWIDQTVVKDHLKVKIGSQSADEEFTGTDDGGLFTNSAFAWDAAVGANVVNGGPIYFAPALGVRAEIRANDHWTARVAAFDGDSFDSPDGDPQVNAHGLHFQLSRQQGMFSMAQLTHTWEEGDDAQGMPGTWQAGAWDHTADFSDNEKDANGASYVRSGLDPAVHHGNRGCYASLQQMVWREGAKNDQGVSLWLRVGSGLHDRSLYEWASDGGFNWTGLVPSRDADVLGVGVATAYVSRDLIAHQRELQLRDGGGDPLPDYERVVEGAYHCKLNEHWSVTPSLQWVQHPGTTTAVKNAWVPSLRISVE